jgi:hypothetical protein
MASSSLSGLVERLASSQHLNLYCLLEPGDDAQ